MSAEQTATIAQQIRDFLVNAWNVEEDRRKNNPKQESRYAAAVATKFVEFVDFSERMLKGMFNRVKQLEAKLAEATGEPVAQAAPEQAAQSQNGHSHGGGDMSDMVRLDANMEPMNPKDQAAEEQADMMIDGAIDMSRYVPRSSLARHRQQPAAAPAPEPVVETTAAVVPPPPPVPAPVVAPQTAPKPNAQS